MMNEINEFEVRVKEGIWNQLEQECKAMATHLSRENYNPSRA